MHSVELNSDTYTPRWAISNEVFPINFLENTNIGRLKFQFAFTEISVVTRVHRINNVNETIGDSYIRRYSIAHITAMNYVEKNRVFKSNIKCLMSNQFKLVILLKIIV